MTVKEYQKRKETKGNDRMYAPNRVKAVKKAVIYGLDWVATVPPTVRLANEAFGLNEGPIAFGWIQTGHQLGAAVAAFGAGVVRQQSGSYGPAFVAAGIMGVVAAGVLLVSRRGARPTVPAIAAP